MSSSVMDLPVADLTIHRFRGLRDLELRGLGQVSILVGENNSGKTSVLEALKLYTAPDSPWTWIEAAGQREPRPFTSRVDRLRYLFPGGREGEQTGADDAAIKIAGGGSLVSATYRNLRRSGVERVRPGETYRDEGDVESIEAADLERRGIEINVKLGDEQGVAELDPMRFWEDERFTSRVRRAGSGRGCVVISPYDHWLRQLAVPVSKAKLEGFGDTVLEAVRILDPRISDIEVLAHRPTAPVVYLREAGAGRLPLSAFGDGLRRVLLIALALPDVAEGGVLLIDEVETAVHVSVLGEVFRWLVEASRRQKVQVVVTTHSLEALDAILAADTTTEEDVVAYRLSRAEGGVVVKRFGEDLLRRLRNERGLDVR